MAILPAGFAGLAEPLQAADGNLAEQGINIAGKTGAPQLLASNQGRAGMGKKIDNQVSRLRAGLKNTLNSF